MFAATSVRATHHSFNLGLARARPLERLGQPEDIAAAVAFLVGPDGAWINGQVLRAVTRSHDVLLSSARRGRGLGLALSAW